MTDKEVIKRYESACLSLGKGRENNPYHYNAVQQRNWERWHSEVLKRGLMGQVRLSK